MSTDLEPLDDLARRINAEHEAAVEAAADAVEHAIGAGRLLMDAKRTVGHGGFSAWVDDHCTFGVRMAQNYMKAAKNEARFAFGAERPKSIRQALAMLGGSDEGEGETEPEAVEPKEWTRHEFNTILPPMREKEFEYLKAGVREYGLTEPITTYQGQILDGWWRYQACQAVGVEPRFEDFEGDGEAAIKFVYSKNVFRQHLTDEQYEAAEARLKERKAKAECLAECEATIEAGGRSALETGQQINAVRNRIGPEKADVWLRAEFPDNWPMLQSLATLAAEDGPIDRRRLGKALAIVAGTMDLPDTDFPSIEPKPPGAHQ